jgi:hypothetical protein
MRPRDNSDQGAVSLMLVATIVFLFVLALSGCSTVVPVTAKFPESPGAQALVACPQLNKLQETAQLSDVAKTVVVNYTEYYTCAVKMDAWIEWYQKQKIIFERLGK